MAPLQTSVLSQHLAACVSTCFDPVRQQGTGAPCLGSSWRGDCSLEERALVGDLWTAGMASLGAALRSPSGAPFVLWE